MLKKKIFALTVMICIVCVGVAYGKWTDFQNVNLETKSGVLEYKVSGMNNCQIILKNDNIEYEINKNDIELVENVDGKSLVITVYEDKLNEVVKDEKEITGIIVKYGVTGTDKNTMNSVVVSDEPQTHRAVLI